MMIDADHAALTTVITSGGTGGHFFPAQALAEELRQRHHKVVFVTDERGLQWRQQFSQMDFCVTKSGTTERAGLVSRLRAIVRLIIGTCQAWSLLGRYRPQVVVGFGGYPTLPTMFAGILRHLLTCIHEQNGVMGRANRLIAPRVNAIALAVATPVGLREMDRLKAEVTGNPVRQAVIDMRDVAYPSLDDSGKIHLLIFGGSQGAQLFDSLLPEAASLLPSMIQSRLEITQQCRAGDEGAVRRAYESLGIKTLVASFFKDLPERIAKSHLVVCRSGASTVSELSVIGRPAILIPYAAALDGDQAANAFHFAEASAGWIFNECDVTPRSLADRIAELIREPETLARAAASARALGRPDAAQSLADLVDCLAAGSHTGKTVLGVA